jgi:hypothetical protein
MDITYNKDMEFTEINDYELFKTISNKNEIYSLKFCHALNKKTNERYLFKLQRSIIYNGMLASNNIIYVYENNKLVPLVIDNKSYLWQFAF